MQDIPDWLYKVLAAPNPEVQGIRERQNARLAAILSLCLLLIFSIYMLDSSLNGNLSSTTDLLSFVILLGIYFFSRTKLHSIGILLLMLLVPSNTFVNIYLGTTHHPQDTLYFLTIGYGLAAIFLRRRWTVLYCIGNVITLLLTPGFAPKGLIAYEDIYVQVTINIILGVIAIVATTHKENIEKERELLTRENTTIALHSLTRALEVRHKETAGHSNRVADITVELAKRAGVKNQYTLQQIREGALLHDVGKIAIPDVILLKEGELSEAEWEIIRKHPLIGFELLQEFDFLKDSLVIPRYHHERFDGSGYPYGLAGGEIPIEARIFAVVDVYDALQEERPYRSAWPEDKIIAYIKAESGHLFDPEIVRIFLAYLIEDCPAAN
ncbi:MAG: HD-GYP domain-containing protein [Anaerolineales bacterium]|nr:HD-GYP domain-containing protein [Anaerolineales bacterium]